MALRVRTALRPDFGGNIMTMKDAAQLTTTRAQRFHATGQPRPDKTMRYILNR
jgi:hypothetical protein